MDNIDTATVGTSVLSQDFSIIHMFLNADIIVQTVMIVLIGVSFWSWAIVFTKFITFRQINELADKFESIFWSGKSLDSLYDHLGARPQDPLSNVFASAMHEWQGSFKEGKTPSVEQHSTLQQRIERTMHVTVNRELDTLEKNMGFLATIGSTAVYIGLFGTVWGIMNSFQGIAASKSTNLAVVAPGIAEALFATALGLVAAIPAVMAYNKLSGDLNRYGNRLDAFVQEFISIISRKLEGSR